MSWALNQGPSFDLVRPGSSYNQLSGFSQRFLYTQDDLRRFPGKKQPTLPAETMKGTFALKKASKVRQAPAKSLVMPKEKVEQIYSGFENIEPVRQERKQPKRNRKRKRKKRVRQK